MGNFAGSAVSPRCATSLTTSPNKRARCSKRACRRKRHSTGTSCQRNSTTSLCFLGDLPSARRSRSFTQSGGSESRSTSLEDCKKRGGFYERKNESGADKQTRGRLGIS